jgi:hypothetical protein
MCTVAQNYQKIGPHRTIGIVNIVGLRLVWVRVIKRKRSCQFQSLYLLCGPFHDDDNLASPQKLTYLAGLEVSNFYRDSGTKTFRPCAGAKILNERNRQESDTNSTHTSEESRDDFTSIHEKSNWPST